MVTLHRNEPVDVNDASQCDPEEVLRVFTENDLSCSLRVLGCQLGLKIFDLNTIERLCSDDNEQYLRKILQKCHERQLLSWIKIASALRKPALKQYKLANRVCRKRTSTTRSSESDSGSTLDTPGSTSFEKSLAPFVEAGKLLPNIMYTVCVLSLIHI